MENFERQAESLRALCVLPSPVAEESVASLVEATIDAHVHSPLEAGNVSSIFPPSESGELTRLESSAPPESVKVASTAHTDTDTAEKLPDSEGEKKMYNSPADERATDGSAHFGGDAEEPQTTNNPEQASPIEVGCIDPASEAKSEEKTADLQSVDAKSLEPEGEKSPVVEERTPSGPEKSVIDQLKTAIGAQFRPPFTPSNSLMTPPPTKVRSSKVAAAQKAPNVAGRTSTPLTTPTKKGVSQTKPAEKASPAKSEVVQAQHEKAEDRMRSSSARPPTSRFSSSSQSSTARASTSVAKTNGGSSSRTPSVPPTSARTVSRRYAGVESRVQATSNYVPQKSNVRIFHQPVKFNVSSRVGSMQNASHVPGGGNLKIESYKLHYKEGAKPKIEDRTSVEIPKSVKKAGKIPSRKLEWNVSSKVGSLENAQHRPSGGNVKIYDQPVKFDGVPSKVGSLDNAQHVPGGGNVKINEYAVQTPSPTNRQNGRSTSSPDANSRRSSSSAAK